MPPGFLKDMVDRMPPLGSMYTTPVVSPQVEPAALGCAMPSKRQLIPAGLVSAFGRLNLDGGFRGRSGHCRCKVGQGEQARRPTDYSKSSHVRSHPTQSSDARRSAPRRPGNGKRKLPDDDDDEGDSNDELRHPGRSCPGRPAKPARRRGLACPFYLYDPVEHRECGSHRFRGFADVKQHILDRKHRQKPHCFRCGLHFDTYPDRDAHLRAPASGQLCQTQTFAVVAGVSQEQEQQIRSPSTRVTGHEEKWFHAWATLFPRRRRPPSPYLTDDEDVRLLEAGIESLSGDDPAWLRTGTWQSPLLASAPHEELFPAVLEIMQRYVTHIRDRRGQGSQQGGLLTAAPGARHTPSLASPGLAHPHFSAAGGGQGGPFAPSAGAQGANQVFSPARGSFAFQPVAYLSTFGIPTLQQPGYNGAVDPLTTLHDPSNQLSPTPQDSSWLLQPHPNHNDHLIDDALNLGGQGSFFDNVDGSTFPPWPSSWSSHTVDNEAPEEPSYQNTRFNPS